MAKVTARKPGGKDTVVIKTRANGKNPNQSYKWWEADTKDQAARQMIDTAAFLKEQQQYRQREEISSEGE